MATGAFSRRGLVLAATSGLVLPGWVRAQDPVGAAPDHSGRGVVEVEIDGQPGLRFALDTAASASVLASDLVARLGLSVGGEIDMHTVVGVERVPWVRAEQIRSGALDRRNARLAVGDRRGMLGLDGLLGLDLLAGHRLEFRFRGRHRASIGRPRIEEQGFLAAERPRVRFAPPVVREPDGVAERLMIVEARVRGVRVPAVIDTGAEVSLINPVLAEAADATDLTIRSTATAQAIQSPTGRAAVARPMVVDALRLGDMVLDRLGVLMGDFHIFRHLGLADRPAMLLGVDVLGVFSRVVIDLRDGELLMEI
ncbi:MAG: aspartyl protease family protein [Alphaproteobacteria bacterium]|nr:aspartyl protease family protein [Alphaproteobacteria bacterium]